MKAKITACSGENYWYKDKINQTFDVEPQYYWFINNGKEEVRCYQVLGTILTISPKDCEILDEINSISF